MNPLAREMVVDLLEKAVEQEKSARADVEFTRQALASDERRLAHTSKRVAALRELLEQ